MASNLDKLREELASLITLGDDLELVMGIDVEGKEKVRAQFEKAGHDFGARLTKLPKFKLRYQSWYSQVVALLKQLLPDRVDDFKKHYAVDPKRKEISALNYVLEDYLHGVVATRGDNVIADKSAAFPRMQQQNAILIAASERLENSLFEIKQIVQADLFDSELDAAKHLLKQKFLRAAGMVAGVVLEKHLAQVCENHSIKVVKKNPTISDLNQLLRDHDVYDIPQWRQITRLGDLRNLCGHNRGKEPTEEDVGDLIEGTDKVIHAIS